MSGAVYKSFKNLNDLGQINLYMDTMHPDLEDACVFGAYSRPLTEVEKKELPPKEKKEKTWVPTKYDKFTYYQSDLRKSFARSTENVYMSVNPRKLVSKHDENASVRGYRGIMLDIDVHNNTISPEESERKICEIKRKIDEAVQNSIIPPPTMIVFSGRGWQLHYRFTQEYPMHEKVSEVHKSILRWFDELFGEKLGDFSTTDAKRVCRIPGTVNLAAGRRAVLTDFSGQRYSLVELIEAFDVDTTKMDPQIKGATKAVKLDTVDLPDNVVPYAGQFLRRSMKHRLGWMKKLIEMRDNMTGYRDLYCLVFFHATVQIYPVKVALEMTLKQAEALRNKSIGVFTDAEVVHILNTYRNRKRLEEAGELFDSNTGEPTTAPYRYSDGRLVELFGITDAEIEALGIGASKAAKERREANKAKAAETDRQIAELWLAGLSIRQIAEQVDLGKSSVHRAIARLGIKDRDKSIDVIDFKGAVKHQGVGRSAVPEVFKSGGGLSSSGTDTAIPSTGADTAIPINETDEEVRKQIRKDFISKHKRMLILGRAGVGKSTILEELVKLSKHPLVLAPTGKAADNIHGSTIHGGLKIPLDILEGDERLDIEVLKETDVLIVDEVGAVRIDLFEYIYRLIEKAERIWKKTVQVVMFGDFGQPAPVLPEKNNELFRLRFKYGCRKGYCFESKHFMEWFEGSIYRLTESKRQAGDEELIRALDAAYVGDGRIVQWFNTHIDHRADDTSLTVCGLNKSVDEYNRTRATAYLIGKRHKPYVIETSKGGVCKQELAVGMPIIFAQNDSKWKNGTLAHIERLNSKGVSVTIDATGKRVVVKYAGDTECLPFMLAYAVTIHKAQGMTLDKVNIMVDAFFTDGMAYVALSRCRSREGMHLIGELKAEHVMANREALKWMGYGDIGDSMKESA
ncbi:MAG: AAA family ATPase [Lachnospiraceae bacterium]|nr:AAA family ATPase [Lachnospiraceae bacterium]